MSVCECVMRMSWSWDDQMWGDDQTWVDNQMWWMIGCKGSEGVLYSTSLRQTDISAVNDKEAKS